MERLQELESRVADQQRVIEAQTQTISELQGTYVPPSTPSQQNRASSSIKAPCIPFYNGEGENRTSSKVKSFIYNVEKAGAFSGITEKRLLALAECYFTDSAAVWLMNLEDRNEKPDSIEALQRAMIMEFVPPDEQARAKVSLMEIKMKGSMDTHVSKFKKLIEITAVPENEEYIFFFMSLPRKFKQKFSEKYPSGVPPQQGGRRKVYENARTWALALKWSEEEGNDKAKIFTKDKWSSEKPSKYQSRTGREPKRYSTKDNSMESWGPAQSGEKVMYIKAGRCMDCGKTGWSDPSHPCRKKGDRISTASKN